MSVGNVLFRLLHFWKKFYFPFFKKDLFFWVSNSISVPCIYGCRFFWLTFFSLAVCYNSYLCSFAQSSLKNGFPRWLSGKESICQCNRCRRCGFNYLFGKILWKRRWQLTPVFLPGESHRQRSLAGYSLWGCKELYVTERARAHTHTHTHGLKNRPWRPENDLPTCFQDFLLIIVFMQSHYNVLYIVFFMFLILGFCWISWVCEFTVFVKFLTIIFIIINHYYFFFLPQELWLHMYQATWDFPTSHWYSVHLFFRFFSIILSFQRVSNMMSLSV